MCDAVEISVENRTTGKTGFRNRWNIDEYAGKKFKLDSMY